MSKHKIVLFTHPVGVPAVEVNIANTRFPANGVQLVRLHEETDKSWLVSPLHRPQYTSGRIAKTFNPNTQVLQDGEEAMGVIDRHIEKKIEAAKAVLAHWEDQHARFSDLDKPYFLEGNGIILNEIEVAELEEFRKNYIAGGRF